MPLPVHAALRHRRGTVSNGVGPSEFFPTDGLERTDDWPEGWFDAPDTDFLPEEFFEDEFE